MKTYYSTYVLTMFLLLAIYPAEAQTTGNGSQAVVQSMEQNDALLDRFARRCERRTKRSERRMARYERKIQKQSKKDSKISKNSESQDSVTVEPRRQSLTLNQKSLNAAGNGLGKEPLLDSLRRAYGFAGQAGLAPNTPTIQAKQSIDRAQQQLDITQRTKAELQQRKNQWKAELKKHPEYARTVGKMEKERYYYTAQVNEYRKVLRDPSTLDDKLMNTLRRDPRWGEFMATLPQPAQDPAKMQPKQLVQQMMQSQAAAIDPDGAKLIADAKKKSSELLGDLSQRSLTTGNLDNAAQVPEFTPNPYRTKSFWERIDIGFDLQFDSKTYFLPSSGVAGVQASFNIDQRISTGLLANYRFGMGDIKHIRFSHMGAGYGAFANYKVWKGLGVQAGFERNWRTDIEVGENLQYPSAWISSALAGLTWEYSISKKAKGTLGVFFDALYKQHTPQTNAILWRMGWKL